MKSVYLCGPITGLSYKGTTDWRKYVARHLAADIVPLSPMRGKAYLKKEKDIAHSYDKSPLSTAKAITTRDRNDVMNCDVMLVNFLGAKVVSVGSVVEFGWADAFRKPVVLVSEKDNIHRHPITDEIVGFHVDNLDEGIKIVNCIMSDEFAKKSQ